MKRISRIIFQDNFRTRVIVMLAFFIGSPIIMLGNSLMNGKDSKVNEDKTQIATDFSFSVEDSKNEPYLYSEDSFEAERNPVFVNEENALLANRNSDEPSIVTFFIFNEEGIGIPGAMITVSDGSLSAIDYFGYAYIDLLDGEYEAEISHPSYENLIIQFIVEGEDLFLEIMLIELPPGSLQMTCPPDVSSSANDMCYVFDIDLGEPFIIDSSPGYVVSNDAPADGFPIGTTVVTWTVENEWGEAVSCDQLVTVDDVEPPTVSPISDITIDNEAGLCGSSASWDPPTASDNCEGVALESSHAPGDFFPIGSTPVIYTATDMQGNSAYAGFIVEVIDVEPPIITTPWPDPYVTIDNAAGDCGANASWDSPTASDNCEGATIESSHAPGDFFPVGSTSVIYTATDVHGNSAYAGFTVEVIDVEPPTLSTINDIVVDVDPGQCSTIVEYDFPVVTENCPDVILTLEEGLVSGSDFPVGITTVTVRAVDDAGNVADSFFSVTVNDNEPPNIGSVPDIIIDSEAGECGASASWESPATSDNCDEITLESSHAPGDFFPVGSTSVLYTATDMHGNPSYSGFTVEVIDVEPPTVSSVADISMDNEPGQCGSSASWDLPTIDDNCEGATLESSHAPGDFFPVGSTSVLYTATDMHGNPSYSGFTVEVIDVEPPTVSPVSDITIDNEPGECGSSASWDLPTIDDNCEGATVESSHAPGDFFPVGSTSVLYTATDMHGNPAYAGFTVEVIDVEPPVAICQDITIQLNGAGVASIAVGDIDDGSSDACGIASLAIDNTEFECADVGDNPVILTVSDNSGNQSTCPATVTVQEGGANCFDCAGVINGTASIDECGVCSGGDTGLIPNESCTDCEGVINGDALPGTTCFNGVAEGVYDDGCSCVSLSLGSLNGNVPDLMGCSEREMTLVLYNADETLNLIFVETVDSNGNYDTPLFSTGSYDILVTVEGYLSKLYENVEIESGVNEMDVADIFAGDLDQSNGVNIVDASVLGAAFGSSVGDLNYNVLADFNCDGFVNIVDASILNITFGMVGDSAPGE